MSVSQTMVRGPWDLASLYRKHHARITDGRAADT
jgi:hypothetical protein